MSQQPPDGIVIRGANGQIWVIRDPNDKPMKLPSDLVERLNPLIDQKRLEEAFNELHNAIAWGCILFPCFVDLPTFGAGHGHHGGSPTGERG